MLTTLCMQSVDLNRWRGLRSRCDARWRNFLVKPSRIRFGNSSNSESPLNRTQKSRRFSPHKSITGASGFIKRTADVAFSVAALFVLSPLLLLIAIAVKMMDGGHVLYPARSVGLQGRRFTIIKVRTLHLDPERDLGAISSVPRDPRCTRIGYFLRRYGLDELPQLWNVLRGEMSLVGPRPERPEFTREFRR